MVWSWFRGLLAPADLGRCEKYSSFEDASRDRDRCSERTATFYEMVTSFYRWGWGESFHFAHRWVGETFAESIKRYEYALAAELALRPGETVLDAGCGVGGPLCNIAHHTGARITGITVSPHQADEGNRRIAALLGPDSGCELRVVDFNQPLPFDDCSFDAAYTIESMCHAKDLAATLGELRRVLKPGGRLVLNEWALHRDRGPLGPADEEAARRLERGNSLEPLREPAAIRAAAERAGLRVLAAEDLGREAPPRHEPWYAPLAGGGTALQRLRISPLGRWVTHWATWCLEALRLAPRGTHRTAVTLAEGADGLVQLGRRGLFTPHYRVSARRPPEPGAERE